MTLNSIQGQWQWRDIRLKKPAGWQRQPSGSHCGFKDPCYLSKSCHRSHVFALPHQKVKLRVLSILWTLRCKVKVMGVWIIAESKRLHLGSRNCKIRVSSQTPINTAALPKSLNDSKSRQPIVKFFFSKTEDNSQFHSVFSNFKYIVHSLAW